MLLTISHNLTCSHSSCIFPSFLSNNHCHSQNVTPEVCPKSIISPSPRLARLPPGAPWAPFQTKPAFLPPLAALDPLPNQESRRLCSLASFYGNCKMQAVNAFRCSQCLCPCPCPLVPAGPPRARECLPYTDTGQYYDGCYVRGMFHQSFQLGTVCWLMPSAKIAVLTVSYNSNKWAFSTKSPRLCILLWKPFYELYYSC